MKLSISIPIDEWNPSRGGLERYLERVCRSLTALGHRVTIICLRCSDGAAVPEGVRVELLSVPNFPRWLRELRFAQEAAAAHRRSGRDVLYAVRHAYEADVYQPHGGCFRMAKRRALMHRSPVVRALRLAVGRLRPTVQVLQWLDREVFRRSPDVTLVSLSAQVEDDFRAMYPDVRFHFRRLYNGVDTDLFHDGDREERMSELHARWNIGSGERVAVFLAHRFGPKGLAHAVTALASTSNWHLVVAGRSGVGVFERQAKQLGVAPRVHFAGPVSDSRALLAGADALVLPTYHDVCALVVLEALACGTPVVTTRQSGSADLMRGSKGGRVLDAPPQDSEIAVALADIGSEWEAYHEAALELRSQLNWNDHFTQIEAVLMEAARSQRDRAAAVE